MSITATNSTRPRDIEQRRKQTANARRAYAERFATPEEKREHHRRLGKAAAARRRVLNGDEARDLALAVGILNRLAETHRLRDLLEPASPCPGNGRGRRANAPPG